MKHIKFTEHTLPRVEQICHAWVKAALVISAGCIIKDAAKKVIKR